MEANAIAFNQSPKSGFYFEAIRYVDLDTVVISTQTFDRRLNPINITCHS